jgi:hypothetical protein
MTTNLENLIRPFQTGEVTPPQSVPEANVVANRNVVLNVGASGQVKTMNGAYNLDVSFYLTRRPKEF